MISFNGFAQACVDRIARALPLAILVQVVHGDMRIQEVLLKICEILCVVLGDTDEVESPQKEAPKELTIDVPQFGGKAESTERPILAQKPGPQCVRRIGRCVLLPELIVRDKSVYWIPHPGNKLDLVAKGGT